MDLLPGILILIVLWVAFVMPIPTSKPKFKKHF